MVKRCTNVMNREDKFKDERVDEAAKHMKKLSSITPNTKVSIAILVVIAGGIWKLAFATSDLFHEVKDMHEAQATFITVAEMEKWQGEFKFNLSQISPQTQVGLPVAGALPNIRAVVNESRKN